jgi:hypothetical protein
MRRVLFSAPIPFGIRNFVATGLCSRIADEFGDVVVVSPFTEPAFIAPDGRPIRNWNLPATPGEWGLPTPREVSLLDKQWKFIHMTGFAQEYPDGSLTMMSLASNRRDPRWWIARGLRALAPRSSTNRDFLRKVNERRRPRRGFLREIFEKENPDLVITVSPGPYWTDQMVMEEASRRRIPTLCVVMSWDNLYSRGPLIRRPDQMAVWSRAMRRQAEQVHDYPPERIHEVGSLQFGYYAESVSEAETRAMRTRVGLGDADEYIAYTCGSRMAAYDVEDVRAMLSALRGTEFAHLKVVLRPHPQGVRAAYAALCSSGVLMDNSPDLTESKTRPDAVNRDEIRHMAAYLNGAAFVMSSWGTTALLEATLLDRPSIQFRWQDSVTHANPADVQMVRDFQRYLHMKDFDAPGARLYSDSPSDLVASMRRLTKEVSDFRVRRKTLVDRIVKRPLDQCVDRVSAVCGGMLRAKEKTN